jgi:hypothetical protein
MKVTKNQIERTIKPSQLQEYLGAGWIQLPQEQAEDVINLKPPARVKSAVKDDIDKSIDIKGE